LVILSTVHDVRPQEALHSFAHLSSLVQNGVEEEQPHPGPRLHGHFVVGKRRLSAHEIIVEVHEEGQRALVAILDARKTPVEMQLEPLLGLVPIDPKPLVEPVRLPPADRRGDVLSHPRPQRLGPRRIVEDQPVVVFEQPCSSPSRARW
jgi:hypothetical protein